MVSIWAIRFSNDAQSSVLFNLASLDDVEVLLCTVGHQNFELHKRTLGPSCEVLGANDLVFPPESSSPNLSLPGHFDGSSTHELVALQLLDRHESHESAMPVNDRLTLSALQRDFWDAKLKDRRPDAVVFANDPHLYYEHVLLGLLTAKKIPYVTMRPTKNYSCIIDHRGNFLDLPGSVPLAAVLDTIREQVSLSGHIYGKNVAVAKQSTISAVILILVKKLLALMKGGFRSSYKHGYFMVPFGHNRFRFPTSFEQRLIEARTAVQTFWNRMVYERLSTRQLPKEDYIYLPLPSRFENTNVPPLSPHTVESIVSAAIRTAQASKMQLVVREHPAAFRFRHNVRFGHKASFYRWLERTGGVRLLHLGVNQLQAIEGAAEVWAGGWSSTLLEASILNRPVRVLGNSGVHQSRALRGGFFRGSIRDSAEEATAFAHRIRHALKWVLDQAH